jgi:hypothetical protein
MKNAQEQTSGETKIEKRYLEGEILIDWKTAFAAFAELAREMNDEIDQISADTKIRNTYSPKTWAKLCWTLRYYIDAMRTVRLHCAGKGTRAIADELGLNVNRARAFVAWNTMRGDELDAKLEVVGTTKEDQSAYENFLTTIGIRVTEQVTR